MASEYKPPNVNEIPLEKMSPSVREQIERLKAENSTAEQAAEVEQKEIRDKRRRELREQARAESEASRERKKLAELEKKQAAEDIARHREVRDARRAQQEEMRRVQQEMNRAQQEILKHQKEEAEAAKAELERKKRRRETIKNGMTDVMTTMFPELAHIIGTLKSWKPADSSKTENDKSDRSEKKRKDDETQESRRSSAKTHAKLTTIADKLEIANKKLDEVVDQQTETNRILEEINKNGGVGGKENPGLLSKAGNFFGKAGAAGAAGWAALTGTGALATAGQLGIVAGGTYGVKKGLEHVGGGLFSMIDQNILGYTPEETAIRKEYGELSQKQNSIGAWLGFGGLDKDEEKRLGELKSQKDAIDEKYSRQKMAEYGLTPIEHGPNKSAEITDLEKKNERIKNENGVVKIEGREINFSTSVFKIETDKFQIMLRDGTELGGGFGTGAGRVPGAGAKIEGPLAGVDGPLPAAMADALKQAGYDPAPNGNGTGYRTGGGFGGSGAGGSNPGARPDVDEVGHPVIADARKKAFDEIDADPELKQMVLAMAASEDSHNEGPLEALFNRAAIDGKSIKEHLYGGFYGPINRGEVRPITDPKKLERAEKALERVRRGSNDIGMRTDQGMINEHKWADSVAGEGRGRKFKGPGVDYYSDMGPKYEAGSREIMERIEKYDRENPGWRDQYKKNDGYDRVHENQGYEAETRKQPIQQSLKSAIQYASEKSGVQFEVFSGGQDESGPNRTGSHRHDNGGAGDGRLFVMEDGKKRYLNMDDERDRPYFESFVKHARAAGATGIGGEASYMGTAALHVGYGDEGVWGHTHSRDSAPEWLSRSFNEGRNLGNNDYAEWVKQRRARIDAERVKKQQSQPQPEVFGPPAPQDAEPMPATPNTGAEINDVSTQQDIDSKHRVRDLGIQQKNDQQQSADSSKPKDDGKHSDPGSVEPADARKRFADLWEGYAKFG